jgi:hypothetical protein
MTLAAMVALAVSAALFVLAPLRRLAPPLEEAAERDRLLRQRDALSRALRDLELDRATGKLSDADYAELAAGYQARSRSVLSRLDILSGAATGMAPDTNRGEPSHTS